MVEESAFENEDSNEEFGDAMPVSPGGATSRCRLVRRHGKRMFMKHIRPELNDNARYRAAFVKEFEIGFNLEHPNIVRYYELDDDRDGIYMLTEYVEGMTLTEMCDADAMYFEKPENVRKLLNQLLDALDYIHSKQVLHLDLKIMTQAFLLFFLMACSAVEKEVRTCIFDGTAQPPLVGAELRGYDMDDILIKGIIVSEDSARLTVSDTTRAHSCLNYGRVGGEMQNIARPYRCIDCTQINRDQYWCALYYLKGHTKYYIRAFVKDRQGNIRYGEPMSLTTRQFQRPEGYADYANVFLWQENTLFDKMTDEIIDPEKDGYYFSTNESPNSCRYREGYRYNTCYKFKTEWSYLLWYYSEANKDIIRRIIPPAMYMEDGKLVIAARSDEKVFYGIDDRTGNPATFTNVYTEPLDVPAGSRVDCYSVNGEGEMSYLNRYWNTSVGRK